MQRARSIFEFAFYTNHRGETLENSVSLTRRRATPPLGQGWSFRTLGPFRIGFRQRPLPGSGSDDRIVGRSGLVFRCRDGVN